MPVNKLQTVEELKRTIAQWQLKNNIVVFTNGCFDILHTGHIHILEEAKKQGHKLIVALNTDASVKKLKGKNRPINAELDRAKVISAIEAVDAVVLFNEETPLTLIKILQPDVLVKGGDYTKNNIVGAKEIESWGGKVVIIPFLQGFSSTSIIEKMKKA
ncbi:MAG: D-glycero-beta-D-manno-heptose 1-phosphate adenylyltransferase [Chitinophagales bacterium]|nr:D-glycero-beta-D-manno-heptose 1-phosphate adenylyltransferase [Chitinophagales bacterium]